MVKSIELLLPFYKAIICEGESIINDKKVNVTKNDIDEIVRIIRDWDTEYRNTFSQDIYTIKVITDKGEYVYKFLNAFPDDYYLLEKFIGDLYARS